jgi:hypothetical protein
MRIGLVSLLLVLPGGLSAWTLHEVQTRAGSPPVGVQGLPAGFPPNDLRAGTANRPLRAGFQKGLVSTDTIRRSVDFLWGAGATVNQAQYRNYIPSLDPTEPMPTAIDVVSFGTRYYPNAVAVLDGSCVLVAGGTEDRNTVIERWDFTWPIPMPVPQTDPTTGITTVALQVPDRRGISRIYLGTAPPDRRVRSMCGLVKEGALSSHALVLWSDNGDIGLLDIESGATSVLASPENAAGALVIPSLGSVPYNHIGFAERFDLGYTYELYRETVLGSRTAVWPATVLIDSDRDGEIDGFRVLDRAMWLAEGWNDPAEFVDPYP